MIYFFKKLNTVKRNKGMTYVELIVVLSIFSVLSSVAIFNYGDFQARIDIKNLAGDIGLKIVEAQKSALSGILPPLTQQASLVPGWKPSYGVYFDRISDNKSFSYFVDINQDGSFVDTTCVGNDECLNKITITKGNIISALDVFYKNNTTASLNDLTITFLRPNSGASIKSSQISLPLVSPIKYVQITVLSPKGATSLVKLYPPGRIEID